MHSASGSFSLPFPSSRSPLPHLFSVSLFHITFILFASNLVILCVSHIRKPSDIHSSESDLFPFPLRFQGASPAYPGLKLILLRGWKVLHHNLYHIFSVLFSSH